MTSLIDKTLYNVVTYAGNGNTNKIELTSKGLGLVCRIAFSGKFKPLSGEAVTMLLQCVGEGRFASHTKGFSSNAVNELTTPWLVANCGAILFPDEFQSWERDDEVFFIQDNPKMLAGNWVSSTYYAEIAASLIESEIKKLKDRIRDVETLPLCA